MTHLTTINRLGIIHYPSNGSYEITNPSGGNADIHVHEIAFLGEDYANGLATYFDTDLETTLAVIDFIKAHRNLVS